MSGDATNWPLRFTLVWTDPPGNPAAGIALVNNLDLMVTEGATNTATNVYVGNDFLQGDIYTEVIPSSTTNVLDQIGLSTNSDVNAALDLVNNVQSVYLDASFGLATNYTVWVRGAHVQVNAVTTQTNIIGQDYALIISSDDQAMTAPLAVTDLGTNYLPPGALVTPAGNGVALLHQRVGANEPNTNEYPGGLYSPPGNTNGNLVQWHFFVFTNVRQPDIIEAAVSGKIRALWIIGTNPLVSFPNIDVLKHALSNLDFLVVQDGFHPTPTTELADLVLPAAIWGEKEGTYTNSERRVSKANIAAAPPGEARSDFDIFLSLAEKLGCHKELFPHWTKPADSFDEWSWITRGRLCDYSGMSYELIEETGGVQWPYPQGKTLDPREASRLYEDGIFQTEDGRAKLIPTRWEPFPEQPNNEFPFVLNTGRTVEHWHTRTKTGGISILQRLSPRAWLEMNPVDAKQLGLRPHDRVEIVSPRGRVSRVELRITEIVAPGQVFLPFHFVESNANQLTQSAFDPISREPNFKQCSVRVERTPKNAKLIS